MKKTCSLRCVCPGYSKAVKTSVKTDSEPVKDDSCNHGHQSNGMPNFKQCDPRWKCHPYAGRTNETSTCSVSKCQPGKMSNNICISGCGIVSTAMVVNFHGNADVTPPVIADRMVEAGFRDDLGNTTGATCNGVR